MPTATLLNAGQVRVQWLASPINPADLNQIEGVYPVRPALPAVGGNEGVGRVVESSSNVLGMGDLVIPVQAGLGTWREESVHSADQVMRIPALPIESACQLMVNPPTAYRLLQEYRGSNDILIQNGGNSAVGQLVIQMAKLMGLRCISVIRDRPDYAALERHLLQLGSVMVIKAERLPLPETIAHINTCLGDYPSLALNCVGGQSATDLARVLAPGGTMVTYGGMSKRPLNISAASLIFQDHAHRGFWLSRWYQRADPTQRHAMLADITNWITQGKLIMPAIQKHPLGDPRALEVALQPYHTHKQVFWMSD